MWRREGWARGVWRESRPSVAGAVAAVAACCCSWGVGGTVPGSVHWYVCALPHARLRSLMGGSKHLSLRLFAYRFDHDTAHLLSEQITHMLRGMAPLLHCTQLVDTPPILPDELFLILSFFHLSSPPFFSVQNTAAWTSRSLRSSCRIRSMRRLSAAPGAARCRRIDPDRARPVRGLETC